MIHSCEIFGEAALLYVGCIYGFWTEAFVAVKGNKGKMKARWV